MYGRPARGSPGGSKFSVGLPVEADRRMVLRGFIWKVDSFGGVGWGDAVAHRKKKNGSKISSTLENMTSSFERTTSAPSGRTKVKSGCSTILLKFKLAMKSSQPWVTLCEITADAPEVERCSSGDLQ